MEEVLYVHYLLLHPNEQAVRRVLRSSSPPVDIPTELVDGLRFLFINIGIARTSGNWDGCPVNHPIDEGEGPIRDRGPDISGHPSSLQAWR